MPVEERFSNECSYFSWATEAIENMALIGLESVVFGASQLGKSMSTNRLLITLSPQVADDLSATSKERAGHFVLFGVPHCRWFAIGRL